MAIKKSMRKLEIDLELEELIRQGAVESGIALLDVVSRHALAVESLPFHHRDPFDRMLIAQARIEGLAVVTRDREFDAYDIERVW
jgi:PIN domain nuclease of toxin-antitoxin system